MLQVPADLECRRRCLADPFAFLATYLGHIFWQPWTNDRREMVNAIVHAASFSGDYALAGPRGEGKTKLGLFVALWLILKRELRLPIIIGKNQAGAENELSNLKLELANNAMLAADFPEVCLPIIALDGWGSRAQANRQWPENKHRLVEGLPHSAHHRSFRLAARLASGRAIGGLRARPGCCGHRRKDSGIQSPEHSAGLGHR